MTTNVTAAFSEAMSATIDTTTVELRILLAGSFPPR